MINLQTDISYAGDPTKAPLKAVNVSFQVPSFSYSGSSDSAAGVTRIAGPKVQAGSISQKLTTKNYSVALAEAFLTGADDATSALAAAYELSAVQKGNLDALTVSVTAIYASADGDVLGQQTVDTLIVPAGAVSADLMMEAAASGAAQARPRYIAVNKSAYAALQQQLADTSVHGQDALILTALRLVTSLDSAAPTYLDAATVNASRWIDKQTGGNDAKTVLAKIKAAFPALTNFLLTIPEVVALAIAGKLKIVAPAGAVAGLSDFKALEVSAECPDVAGGAPRVLTFRFDDRTTITGGSAAFVLATATDGLFRNLVQDPIVVRVRGADSVAVWTKQYKSADPTLASLDISVPLPVKTELTGPPDGTRPESALKLRGRVVTFKKDCVLKDVLVLVQAKSTVEGAWRIVGAATTDTSGNFGMPYPYGTYVQARAVVSLAPTESVDIPIVAKEGDETIADDFLYVLVNDPDCPAPAKEGECDCSKDGKPNRLPDFSDLIGSDAYTQDIGGSCVNLSKPNRTLSEFNFKGIVRLSDPDVATYTLTRIETGLDAIDAALLASLASGADAVKTALESAQSSAELIVQPLAQAAQRAVGAAYVHGNAVDAALSAGGEGVDFSVLAAAENHVQAIIGIIEVARKTIKDSGLLTDLPGGDKVDQESKKLKDLLNLAIDTVGTAVHYELNGGTATRQRQPVALNNAILWQNPPEVSISSAPQPLMAVADTGAGFQMGRFAHGYPQQPRNNGTSQPVGTESTTSFSQAVSVATGHILHYKALFKADGYSMGDLLYSLPLAPGQKKEIVVIDATHTLVGAETQAITQNERLAMGLVDERDITSQLAGTVAESLRGSSSADTKGISAGFGTGGQGYGNYGAQGTGYGGSGSAVIGVAGGYAQATANAAQDSSRDVAEFFREKLRQSIMQNAEGYRQLNASVVTTVQEGQRYGVTSEVVANHNHCHALTMMYFEVLRHYAIYQELSEVEECVFVPFLLTRFTTENIAKWRDVLAPALLPMSSDTYLQPSVVMAGGRQHPLIKAFDADQRIRNHYANVDYPEGSYDEELIQFLRGYARIRISLPRPRTRFDRIMSLPITKQLDTGALADAATKYATDAGRYAAKAAVTAGFSTLFDNPPGTPPNPEQYQVLAREAIFDVFMSFDGDFQSVPPAQCIRIKNFNPPATIATGIPNFPVNRSAGKTSLDVFADNLDDRNQWQAYADLLGYADVETMLNAHFRGNLISEWDTIFNTDIAPLAFEKILDSLNFKEITLDWSADTKYHGGEQLLTLNLAGTASARRRDLPPLIHLGVNSPALKALRKYVTLNIQDLRITYSTSHYNGVLYSGPVGDDLLDGTTLPIPESADERRNPRREDRYLAARLIEHLNSNLEYYNKVLWRQLDPDRRYMLLDGFSIQVYDDDGNPITGDAGKRSLATVIKNELVTVAGNSLVFPVAPGYRVSGNFVQVKADGEKEPVTLFDHYKPLTPMEPDRVSVPSKGVFAEAVQGACNACEKIESERLQDWNRFPNVDEPTSISPIVTPTPTVTDWKAAFKDFAAPIVNVQNAPGLPAPGAGLAGLGDLLGKAGVFKDITGLDATQQNALKTYLSNQENAKAFAEMAKEMAMQSHNTANSDKITEQIDSAKAKGSIDSSKASQLTTDHLQQMIDGGQTKKAEVEKELLATPSPLTQAAVDAVGRGRSVKAQRSEVGVSDESLDVGETPASAGEELTADSGITYVSGLEKAGEVAIDIGMDIVKHIIDDYFKGTRVTIDQLKDGGAFLHGYTDLDDYIEPASSIFGSPKMTVSIENLGGNSTMSGLNATLEVSWDDGFTLDPDKLKPEHRAKKPWLPYIQCKGRILVLPVKGTAGMALDNAVVKLDLIGTKPPIPTRVTGKGLVMNGVEMIPTLVIAITLTPKYGGGDIVGTKQIPLSRLYDSMTVRIVNDSSGTGFDVIMPKVTIFPGPQFA